MFYGGMTGVPGAPGNLVAGSPGYFPSDKEVQDRLFNYGMQNTPAGREIQNNIKKLQQTFPPGFIKQASESSLGPGNAAGIANASFYEGPQGPHTPLPAPGWNPGMIKPPGNPNFRPKPLWEQPGPTPGSTIPWKADLPAGFQNKTVV